MYRAIIYCYLNVSSLSTQYIIIIIIVVAVVSQFIQKTHRYVIKYHALRQYGIKDAA